MELKVDNISVAYNGRLVLKEISLAVAPGEVLGILGPNGSGKTTLLRTIAGFLKPKKGVVYINGISMLDLGVRDRSKLVALIPPTPPSSNMASSVMDFLVTARYPYTGILSLGISKNDLLAIEEAVKELRLTKLVSRRLDQLSSGELQRVLIAHAIAKNASILLADEPTAFLDLSHKIAVFRLLRNIAKRKKNIIVLATHEILIAPSYLDKVLVLKNGYVKAYGETWATLTPKVIKESFGVDVDIVETSSGRIIVVK